ncbi:MAG: biotin/lipoyl-containing protein, partial [Candidatus Poseidoniales archaeon]
MGIYAFRLPDIGEGVVEGEVVEWMVTIGQEVKEDDAILSVMTDKATVEIPSPADGKVISRKGEPGDIIAVGQICIEFEVEGKGNATEAESPAAETKVESNDEIKEAPAVVPEPKEEAKTETIVPVSNAVKGERKLASPAVRRRARESGIDLVGVAGSGPAGRITHSDLDSWKEAGSPVAAAGPNRSQKSGTIEIPVIGLRKRIAESMTASYTTIPHFSYFEEVDVTELESLRQHLNANRAAGMPKLTYL